MIERNRVSVPLRKTFLKAIAAAEGDTMQHDVVNCTIPEDTTAYIFPELVLAIVFNLVRNALATSQRCKGIVEVGADQLHDQLKININCRDKSLSASQIRAALNVDPVNLLHRKSWGQATGDVNALYLCQQLADCYQLPSGRRAALKTFNLPGGTGYRVTLSLPAASDTLMREMVDLKPRPTAKQHGRYLIIGESRDQGHRMAQILRAFGPSASVIGVNSEALFESVAQYLQHQTQSNLTATIVNVGDSFVGALDLWMKLSPELRSRAGRLILVSKGWSEEMIYFANSRDNIEYCPFGSGGLLEQRLQNLLSDPGNREGQWMLPRDLPQKVLGTHKALVR